jgi:hypothetical protein
LQGLLAGFVGCLQFERELLATQQAVIVQLNGWKNKSKKL